MLLCILLYNIHRRVTRWLHSFTGGTPLVSELHLPSFEIQTIGILSHKAFVSLQRNFTSSEGTFLLENGCSAEQCTYINLGTKTLMPSLFLLFDLFAVLCCVAGLESESR